MVCQKQVLPVFGLRFERGPEEPQTRRPPTVFAVADTDAPRRRAKVTPFIQSSSLQAEQVPSHHRLLLLEEHLAAA